MYLKIVPAAELDENTVVLEVDRIDSRIVVGVAESISRAVTEFIGAQPPKVAGPQILADHQVRCTKCQREGLVPAAGVGKACLCGGYFNLVERRLPKGAVPHDDVILIGASADSDGMARGPSMTVTLITAYRPSGRVTLIAALESDIYLMNDKGSSVDRVKGRSCL